MARDRKLEVAGINVRIPEDSDRNYSELLQSLARVRRGFRVHGDTYLAINSFSPKTGQGVISKYTEIEAEGSWFDLENFDRAAPDKVARINIPENLRPNLSQFYFMLDEGLHVVAFETYSDSAYLSPRAAQTYFREVLGLDHVVKQFGEVEADVVKDYGDVEEILDLPDLRELRMTIRRPNPDDVGDDLARVIEELLREQRGREYEEIIRSKQGGIEPNDRTRKLAVVAAENGEVQAKAVIDGIVTNVSTDDKPLVEREKLKADAAGQPAFVRLARRIFNKIREMREIIRG